MNWVARYIPPERTHWHGRPDLPENSCIFQIIKPLDLRASLEEIPAFALLGFQCDEGVSRNLGRTGAVDGPHAIRKALAKLPVSAPDFICYDAGDISCSDQDLEQAQAALAEAVALLLEHHFIPVVLGGGHELAWGHYQGIAKYFPKQDLGIVNFDAHFDMRPLLAPQKQGSSGTPFLQIAQAQAHAQRKLDYNCVGIQPASNIPLLFATAKQYQVHYLQAEDINLPLQDKVHDFIKRIIQDNQVLYVSLCLDVFAADIAPGVSAPQPFGVTPWQIIPLLRQLASSGKVISYDIAELCPLYDIDHRTAKLAAAFIFEIFAHHKSFLEKNYENQ